MKKKKQSEKEFHDDTRMALQGLGLRMFRNNNGVAEFHSKGKKYMVRYGLGTGTSDLIGWTPVIVTQKMVGTQVAVFTALEGKRGRDVLTDEQKQFIETVIRNGGISGTFKSSEQAMKLITGWRIE